MMKKSRRDKILTTAFGDADSLDLNGLTDALALPVGLSVALENMRSISSGWDSPAQVSLFLRAEMSAEAGRRLEAVLQQRDDVGATRFVSREEALAEFEDSLARYP